MGRQRQLGEMEEDRDVDQITGGGDITMHIHSNQSGGTRFKVFLWFVFLFLGLHVGLKIVPLYMDHARMKDEMVVKASVAQVLKDEEILRDLESKAKDLDLPLKAENFVIQRDDERRRMKISTKWDTDVVFLWGVYTRTFHFQPVAEERFMTIVR
jgi:hypothetical protein